MTSRRVVSRGLRDRISRRVRKLGLRIGRVSEKSDEISAAERAEVEAVRALLAPETSRASIADRLLRSADTFRNLIGRIDRIAAVDELAANELRRMLGTRLFAEFGSDVPAEAWLGGGVATAELEGGTSGNPDADFRLVVDALKTGADRILTTSPRVAYFATLADLPTALASESPVDAADLPLLSELARSPALVAATASSRDMETQIARLLADSRAKISVSREDALARLNAVSATAPFRPDSSARLSVEENGDNPATVGAKVLWLYGSEEQSDWAYGINARRLATRLGKYRHYFGIKSRRQAWRFDIKFLFDGLVARQRRARRVWARRSVLRVGGPAPLKEVSGGNRKDLADFLAPIDALIALSPELSDELSALHPRVFFVPNGIDLGEWRPTALPPRDAGRPFRAGIAASLRTKSEQDLKGYLVAVEACELAGVELLVVGRGMTRVPHQRMIQDFYSQIDVLIHPTGPGKEACSNVVMESLALGIPVVTTRYAGMHGAMLEHRRHALIVPRFFLSFAAALQALKRDADLRRNLAGGGRQFAEQFHDLDRVGRGYERVFEAVLRTR